MDNKECCAECTPDKLASFLEKVKPIFKKEFPKCAEKMKDCCDEKSIKKMLDSIKESCPCCHMMNMRGEKSECCKDGDKSECCKSKKGGKSCCK